MKIIYKILDILYRIYRKTMIWHLKHSLGLCSKSVSLGWPIICNCPQKIYLEENTNIFGDSKIIINSKGDGGKFIMKKNAGAAMGLTVITGNHTVNVPLGHNFKEFSASHVLDKDEDVIVEEDVWIGANVTLTSGVKLGRGSIIGAGSVIRNSIPPYSIVMGNPAKIIGFRYKPENVISHEGILYPEDERIAKEVLEHNYDKYFLKKMKEIRQFTRL